MKLIEAKELIEEFIASTDPKILPAKYVQAMCVILLELGNKNLFEQPVNSSIEEISRNVITGQLEIYDFIKDEVLDNEK